MKQELSIESFLADVSPEYELHIRDLHDSMVAGGFGLKFQEAKSGVVVSYLDPKTKKTVLNFVTRRKGPLARVYADNIAAYEEVLASMPEEMKAALRKAGICKRLAGISACNSRCPMGYEFSLDGEKMQKCRYNLMFAIDDTTINSLKAILQKEISLRTA